MRAGRPRSLAGGCCPCGETPQGRIAAGSHSYFDLESGNRLALGFNLSKVLSMSIAAVNYPEKLVPFIEYMDGLTERPELDELVKRMRSFDVTVEELGEYVQFHGNHYRRNMVFENEHVQLLCLCWKSGQRSPIHDHAESICGVKVITGVASETVYEMTPSGFIKPVSTVDYGVGVIGSQDEDTHQVANLQRKEDDLVTLHCYAPPLKKMKTFSIDSKFAQVYEPVNEWHMGGSGI